MNRDNRSRVRELQGTNPPCWRCTASAQAGERARASDWPRLCGPFRLLVVEQGEANDPSIATALERVGGTRFVVDRAPRLATALTDLDTMRYDAIVVDLEVPDARGKETLEDLRLAAPSAALLVITVEDDEALALDALRDGAQDFLVKGWQDGRALARAVRYAIERKRTEHLICFMAYHDGLTGLPNRALFDDRLERALARAQRADRLLAVIFLDLDFFKAVNDTYGHAEGDELLAQVGRRLQDSVRGGDTVARFGGDEFVVLLPEIASADDAAATSLRLSAKLRRPFAVGGRLLNLSASVGWSVFPRDGSDAVALVKAADAAMYRAKLLATGRRFGGDDGVRDGRRTARSRSA